MIISQISQTTRSSSLKDRLRKTQNTPSNIEKPIRSLTPSSPSASPWSKFILWVLHYFQYLRLLYADVLSIDIFCVFASNKIFNDLSLYFELNYSFKLWICKG